MNLEQLDEQQKDFQKYLLFLKSRKYLTDTDLLGVVERVYKKIYMITTIAGSLGKVDSRSDIENFYYESKNNLILSLDLCNINYYNASKQLLRSAIESFFRLCLALERYIVYRTNKQNNIFHATPELTQLKNMQYTHSVGKVTRYIVRYFSTTSVSSIFSELNTNYSILSGNVHVNKKENFTPHKYLMDYVSIDRELSEQSLYLLEKTINAIIIILYYFTFQLTTEGVSFTKRDITEFSHTLKTTNVLDEIEKESYL
jgi:hypothetical protein